MTSNVLFVILGELLSVVIWTALTYLESGTIYLGQRVRGADTLPHYLYIVFSLPNPQILSSLQLIYVNCSNLRFLKSLNPILTAPNLRELQMKEIRKLTPSSINKCNYDSRERTLVQTCRRFSGH